MDQGTIIVWTGVCTFAGGLLLKIVWDWLKDRRENNYHAGNPAPAPAIPHAKNGFLTFSEIKARCNVQQTTCTKLLHAGFQNITLEITNRLKRGDDQFRESGRRFKSIEKTLSDHSEILESVETTVQDLVKTINDKK